MGIYINVVNQKMNISSHFDDIIAGTQRFVKFRFNLSEEWDGLTVFAQFRQGNKAYNEFLDEEKSVYLPPEIKAGTCTLMLYGSHNKTVGTTNYLTLKITENILVSDASSTDISETLYEQLVTMINGITDFNGQGFGDLSNRLTSLESQIKLKASNSDLITEVDRSKKKDASIDAALLLKADQSQVDELELKVTELANNEVISNLINSAVEDEMAKYLASGQLANMAISNGSITRAKMNTDVSQSLMKADSAMQPSVYDKKNKKTDVYEYAEDLVDGVKQIIEDSYQLTDKLKYTSLKDTIQGAVSVSRNYTDAAIANFKAFSIEIVNELPLVGEEQTFYLMPKESGNGYDKYWYIGDDNGRHTWDVFGGSSTVIVDSLPQSGDIDVDYILSTPAGCLYYKYIDGEWRVIAGSIAHVSATLPDVSEANELTDYYVVDQNNGSYVHYRLIDGEFCAIGGNSYTKDEVDAAVSELREGQNIVSQKAEANETNISSLSGTLTKLQQDFNNLDVDGYTYYATYGTTALIATGEVKDYVYTLYQCKDGQEEVVSQFVIAGGGSSSGETTTTNLVVERVTSSPIVATPTDKIKIQYTYSSTDSDGEEIDGSYTWKLGGAIIAAGPCVQGLNEFDATEFVNIGTQKLTLTVIDDGGSAVVKNWTVQIVDVRLESTFSDRITYPVNRPVNFTYTPYGAVSKTVHFILDGEELEPVVTTASGTLQSYSLPAKTHGAHLLECYITATINGLDTETAHIFKDIIWFDEDATTPVIGCIYRSDYYSEARANNDKEPGKVYARQYDSTIIPYYVFDPATGSPTVSRTEDGVALPDKTLTQSADTWLYKTDDIGEHTLVISCRDTSVTIVMDIQELGVDISPVTANMAFDFNPAGMSNNGDDRLWIDKSTGVSMSVSDDFDWINGGYQVDADGNQYFCVKAGTEAVINYKLFEQDASVYGSEFKVVFKVDNVRDVDATFLSCLAGETAVGLRMDAHAAYLMTSGTGSSPLYMPYSESDIIEFEFNINPLSTEDAEATSLIMSYEDGTGYRPLLYNSSHRLYQYSADAVPITIGSPDCDVHIYRMKAYTTALSDSDILNNFIADARDSETMLQRYDRNDIYDENNTLTPSSVAKACPDLKIILIDAPYFTRDKKEMIKDTTVQCIHKNGDPILDNWTARNCYHSGQGTTSNEYGYAGRNLNIYMCFDGHYTNKNCTYDPDYITELTMGDGTKYTDGTGKVTLTRGSVPNSIFNIKVNIASSENANNALLAQRYHRYLPYTPVSAKRDANAKTTMEFANCVVFVRENNSDLSTHREFKDTDWHFYAIGNIGDSKDTDHSRTNDPDDRNEFVVEIADNTLPNSIFPTGINNAGGEMKYPISADEWEAIDGYELVEDDLYLINENIPVLYELVGGEYVHTDDSVVDKGKTYYMARYKSDAYKTLHIDVYKHNPSTGKPDQVSGWGATYEFRYLHPDASNEDKARGVQIWNDMYRWVITSSDDEFVSEIGNWFIEDAVPYMYLFTERYTMLDNRAKNTFWHWGKVYISDEEATVMGEEKAAWFTLDNEKAAIHNGYRFDFWDYDNDTSLGINNSGEMTQPYGREDIDYRTDGDPDSGYVFNAAESTFFRRVRNLMGSQLSAMYLSRETANAWSATGLINEFDNWQNQFCEELWRLDTERKYYRTYQGGGLDGGLTPEPTPRFLVTMMNGRKKYHRRQWERDQEAYMGTKYVSANVKRDQIMFRCNTPVGAVVTPNYDLSITPYTDMYLSVLYGNSSSPIQVRAKAGNEYTIENPLGDTMDDTAILIYNASRIQALNDLSGCYIHDNDFSKASRLQKLIIGNSTNGYSNAFMTGLNIGNNQLLQELNVQNCPNLVGSVNLTNCGNLESFYAEGTSITGVSFAPSGKIRSAHLPNTVNTLSMKNLRYLTDLDATYENLESFTEENSIIDEKYIVEQAVDTLQTLRLIGIDWTIPDTSLLDSILSMDRSVLSGKVHISGSVGQQDLINYQNAWPDLVITYVNKITQHKITYVNADANNTVLCELYVNQGDTPVDPYVAGIIPKPTLQKDAQYEYEFEGWDNIVDDVITSRTVVARYKKTVRQYTVTWYERAGVMLASVVADYGSEAVYPGDAPVNESEEDNYVYNLFAGWDKSTGFITGDIDVYAIWKRADLPAEGTDLKDMTPEQIYAVSKSGRFSSYNFEMKDYFDMSLGHDFDFTNVESEVLAENLYLDGNTAIDKQITLFGENDRSFTIAIDFQYADKATNGTLVSCFEEDGLEGFRLRYNNNPNIQWGDRNVSFGNGIHRDIVVIRHRKGDDKLYIYASNDTSSATLFSSEIMRAELTRTRSTNTQATLVFGAIKFIEDGGYDDYGRGHIHWCKIWHDDLGDTNARQLASWHHEPLRMEYCGTGKYRIVGGGSQKSNASFICNHVLAGRGIRMNNLNLSTNVGGWDNSTLRKFMLTRMYSAIPTVWKSVIKHVKVDTSAGGLSYEILSSSDYIYLPCSVEMCWYTNLEPYTGEGSQIPWYVDQKYRVKFYGYKTPDDAKYYSSETDPSSNSVNNVKFGDVWLKSNEYGFGYTYVDEDYLQKYNITQMTIPDGQIVLPAAAGGAWVRSAVWWTRSPQANSSSYFLCFGRGGAPNGYNANGTYGICPCFSI